MTEGREAFSLFRPDEEVSAFLGPDSILKRMVGSVLDNLFLNKVLVELKRAVLDINKKH